MDQNAYLRCLEHLHAAERCMVEKIDGWHLARLSMVVERLKEDYAAGSVPSCIAETKA